MIRFIKVNKELHSSYTKRLKNQVTSTSLYDICYSDIQYVDQTSLLSLKSVSEHLDTLSIRTWHRKSKICS